MKRFMTCCKALAAPLVICLSSLMLFVTILVLSWLSDCFGIAARIKYLIGVLSPTIKDMVWPIVLFCIACLFKDEIIAVLFELKTMVSKVRQFDTAGFSIKLGGGDRDAVGDGVGRQDVPELAFDADQAIEDYCVKDATKCFGLVLQRDAELTFGDQKIDLPWVDIRSSTVKVLKIIRIKNYRDDIMAYLTRINDFLVKSKMAREDLMVYVYAIWGAGEARADESEDFSDLRLQLTVKSLNASECLRK